jgi:hypothetical protein
MQYTDMEKTGWKRIGENQWERPVMHQFKLSTERETVSSHLENFVVFLWNAMFGVVFILIPISFFAIILFAFFGIGYSIFTNIFN